MLPRKEASKAAASVMAAALKKLRHVQAYILRTALLDPSVRLWKSLYDIFGCSFLCLHIQPQLFHDSIPCLIALKQLHRF